MGDSIVIVALALFVTDLTGSATDVGIVLAAQMLPMVAFLLIGGVWADRLPRARLMIATDLVRLTLHTLLAILIFTGQVEIWHLVVIEALFGTAEAFFRPALHGTRAAHRPRGRDPGGAGALEPDREPRRAHRTGARHRARARGRRGLGLPARRGDLRGERAAAHPRRHARTRRRLRTSAGRCSPSWPRASTRCARARGCG